VTDLGLPTPPPGEVGKRPGPLARPLVVVAGVALLANVSVYGLGRLAGVDFEVVSFLGNRQETVGPRAIAVMTLTPMLLGGLALTLTRRWATRAWRVLAWAGVAVGIITMPVFNQAALDTKLTLALMHLITAGLWLHTVQRLTPTSHPGDGPGR
jgi:hypothetical protein